MSENLRFVRIGREDAEYFSFLDPFEKLNLLSMPYGFAIGALSDTGESLAPVGLLVGTVTEDMITIEWIVVEPEHQYQGIGEEMLVNIFKMGESAHIETIAAVIQPDYEKEDFTKGAKDYFAERLFEVSDPIGGDICYKMIDLTESEFMSKEYTTDAEILPFTKMTGPQKIECLERLGMMDNGIRTFDPTGFGGRLDEELCFVSTKGKAVEGALLVYRSEKEISPVYYYAKTEALGDAIISAVIKAAAGKYGKGQDVLFTMRQPETKELVEKLMGEQEAGELLKASVAAFAAMPE